MADVSGPLSESFHQLRQRQLQAWRGGQALLVESLASDVVPPLPEHELLELILAEITLRTDLNDAFTWEEYARRFPELADVLRQRFADQQQSAAESEDTRSFIGDVADESVGTVDEPKPGITNDSLDHTVLGDSQELGTDDSLADVNAPAALASTVTYISSSGIGTQHKGRYGLDRILGEGAFGQVYLAFDEELQRQVPTKARFQKPEDASNTPFVADFGLAIREEDSLKQNVLADTPAYMSPEQALGEGHRLHLFQPKPLPRWFRKG